MNGHWGGLTAAYDPVMKRLPLFGLGATGAGLAAVAVAAVVGIGQLAGGQTACHRSSALSSSALSSSALSSSALLPSAPASPVLSLAALSQESGTGSGIATHYVLTGLPNCSYPSPPADGLFVALPPSQYDGAAACGGYLTVSGPDGSVTVQVIDQCPDCATGHIDLSEAAFAELAPLSAGQINVRYQYLADPALPGPITMEVKSGSSRYWLALLAGNTGNPLASVQVETSSGGWLSLARASYNYWIAPSGGGPAPFTVRLTDTEGNQVTVGGVALDPGAVQSTGVWMYGAGGAASPPAAVSAPADAKLGRRRHRPGVILGRARGGRPVAEENRGAGGRARHRPRPGPGESRAAPVGDPIHHLLTFGTCVRGRTLRLFSFPRGRGNVGGRAPRGRAKGGVHARVAADQRILAGAGIHAATREHARVGARRRRRPRSRQDRADRRRPGRRQAPPVDVSRAPGRRRARRAGAAAALLPR